MYRAHSSIHLSSEDISSILAIFPKGIVALDLETTGLSPLVDKIIEMAAVKISPNGSISTFHQLINPLVEIPPSTIQYHGLKNEDLHGAPTIKKPLKEFWSFTDRLPVIAHNSTFDLGHLIKSSHDHQIEFPPLDVFDSCRYARSIYKNNQSKPQNFKLSTLAHFSGFELNHHVAIEDTYACLKILSHLKKVPGNHQQALEKSFVFRLSSFNKNECFNFSTRLKGLTELVKSHELIEIGYKGNSSKEINRPIRPIALMPLPKGPVLFAECLLTGKNKSFILKKIKTFKKLQASLYNPRYQNQ